MSDPHTETLFTGIQRQLTLATSLLDAIRQEQLGLRNNDIAAIETAVAIKQRCIEALDSEQDRLTAALMQAGFAPELAGFEAFIGAWQDPRSASLRDAFNELRAVAQQCRDENIRNGHLNAACRRRAQELLAIVRGETIASPRVYASNGAVTSTASKPIARA